MGSAQNTEEMDARPWAALPPRTAGVLRPHLPEVGDEMIEAIRRGVPEYARPLQGPFGAGLRAGVIQALERFVDMVEQPRVGADPAREVYVELGRGEMRAGRPLEALLAAYRLGARVAWRRLAAAGEAADLEPRTLYLLAESIFAYIDELSSESIEGYAMEQAAVAGAHQRRRRRLAAMLVQEPPADGAAIQAAALEANWSLPDRLAAVYFEHEDADQVVQRAGADVIATGLGQGTCALVPDPDGPGRGGQIERAFGAAGAALGPAVPWREAAVSAVRARAAHALAGEGMLGDGDDGELLVADRYPVALLLGLDRRLSSDIAEAALAPLDGERPSSRVRLLDTLEQWLRHRGRTEQVAEALHVHPQTVRYRIGRLRDLYGDVLDDPDARFALELALRASRRSRPPGDPG